MRLHGYSRYAHTQVGWWAWLLQRITGVALVGYLFLHIIVISTALLGAETFDDVLSFLQTPVFVVLDLGLIAIVLYHTLNGIRVIFFDLGIGVRAQAPLWWSMMAVSVAAMIWASAVSWPLIFR